ncbi:MAG: hypothetical protein HQL82_05410 [Magnetococcales bacterium]|nr:hypothetical protein [Magnetococcales bacterium]
MTSWHPVACHGKPSLRHSVFSVPAKLLGGLTALAILLAGCGTSILPSGKKISKSPWSSFAAAKSAYDSIVPYGSTESHLRLLGFDPFVTPNIKVLNYLDVVKRFNYHPSHAANYPRGVRECVAATQACTALDIRLEDRQERRVGAVLADFFSFERQTHETGWTFNALILLRNKEVIYKLWSGQPRVDEMAVEENPLGPLQGMGYMGSEAIERQVK